MYRLHSIPRPFLWPCLAAFFLSACYGTRPTSGGGRVSGKLPRPVEPRDIALPEDYRIEAIATGLTYPTAVTFDDSGGIYVVEGGYAYGDAWAESRLLRVDGIGNLKTVAAGDSNGPWTGAVYHEGSFYVAEGGHKRGGRILRITPGQETVSLVEGLPSFGDHHTNGPAIGSDKMIYFGQGTATNSGVVGEDNYGIGWLSRRPDFHDIPCQDVVLKGRNFSTGNPLTSDKQDSAVTGAFRPFGTATVPGEIVKGELPCSGAIMRVPMAGGKPELVAWGFRNPFGLAFSTDGRLFVVDNGYDQRGSRHAWGTADLLWAVEKGQWYGWPDFSGQKPLDDPEFRPPQESKIPRLLHNLPGEVPSPAAYFPVHSSADGMDFSRSPDFGHVGQAFVAQFGDMAPAVGKVLGPVGFRVVRVQVNNGLVEEFAVNRKSPHGPASLSGHGGLERPVGVRFSPDGRSLYVVDFGVMTVSNQGPKANRGTGVLWRIWKEARP